ncbi:hypothetical protein CLU79DRAFT_735132 [Phycomyces nitens]|nr:hypothetical protein CLU79DRAFT_735132 [Phycomyces nitens]
MTQSRKDSKTTHPLPTHKRPIAAPHTIRQPQPPFGGIVPKLAVPPASVARRSNGTLANVMSTIPEHSQPMPLTVSKRQARMDARLLEDDVPLALLAYKKGYTPVHSTQSLHSEPQADQLTVSKRTSMPSTGTKINSPTRHHSQPSHTTYPSKPSLSHKRSQKRPSSAEISKKPSSLPTTKRHSMNPVPAAPISDISQPQTKHKRWFSLRLPIKSFPKPTTAIAA